MNLKQVLHEGHLFFSKKIILNVHSLVQIDDKAFLSYKFAIPSIYDFFS